MNNPLINHIDGIKQNNGVFNLEWCSPQHNASHALGTGLIKTSIPVNVRDVGTGEVVTYPSLSAAFRELGIGRGVSLEGIGYKLPGYLWKDKCEIKAVSDETPWYHEQVNPGDYRPGKSYFSIRVFDTATQYTRRFNDFGILCKTYGLVNRSRGPDELIAQFKEKYPNLKIRYERNTVHGPYYVYKRGTKQLHVLTSIQQLSDLIGRTRAELQKDLSSGRKYIYDGWIIVTRSSEFDIDEYVDKPKPYVGVLIVDSITGESRKARSIKHAARLTGLNEKTIKFNLDTGKIVKSLVFRALDS